MRIVIALVLALVAASPGSAGSAPDVLYPQRDGSLGPKRPSTLAQCLAQKHFIFYGASWCPYCREQKALFGEDAINLPYVECSADGRRHGEQTAYCDRKGIRGYPTWVFPDRSEYHSVLSIDELVEASGCPKPY